MLLAASVWIDVAAPVRAQPVVTVEEATPGVTFAWPVGVKVAPGQEGRLYVLEQGDQDLPSRVRTLAPGDAQATTFLDVSDRAVTGGEAGLLGLAFHPGYAGNGRLFVYYTAPASGAGVFVSRVSEFARSASDPLRADPASERVVLEVPQPATNHNGGTVTFGPDGFLYVGLGDGGGGGDPFGNGQDPATLLGAILRLDVDDVPDGQRYGVPADNPFAASAGPERAEIWAYGFRNPYRFSVSDAGLWVGDVGQNEWEEVDLVEPGGNYGWNEVEGPECYQPGCDLGAFQAPVVSYPHTDAGGYSITGGYVVSAGGLDGYYLYGDFITGRLWGLPGVGEAPVVLLESVPDGEGGQRQIRISSIDDSGGDVLVTDYGGTIYRLVLPSTAAEPDRPSGALAVTLAGPNPSRGPTAVCVRSDRPVRVVVVDVRGREVAVLWDGPAPPDRLAVGDALAPGVYTVRAVSDQGSATLRLVRVR